MKITSLKKKLMSAGIALALSVGMVPAAAMASESADSAGTGASVTLMKSNTWETPDTLSFGSTASVEIKEDEEYFWKFTVPSTIVVEFSGYAYAPGDRHWNTPQLYVLDENLKDVSNSRVDYENNSVTNRKVYSDKKTLTSGTYYIHAKYAYAVASQVNIKISTCIDSITLQYSKKGFTGGALFPQVKVKSGLTTLPASAYALRYSKNVKAGQATVTATGTGIYSGSVQNTFNIIPAKVTGVKAKAKAHGKVKITWSNKLGKMAGVTGYKIFVKNPNTSWWSTTTEFVKGASKHSKTLDLSSWGGDKVKVSVWAYKTIDGQDYFSPVSKKVKVKVRK